MSQSKYLTINLTGNHYNFYYSYNQNSTFDDLLESFSYNYPNLKICPCYKIIYIIYNNKGIYNNYINNQNAYVNMKEKVYNYMSSNVQFQLIKKNNKCTCDQLIKYFFLKPKLEIIEYIKEVENELQQQVEILKQQVSQLTNENNKLKNNYKNLQNDNYSLENNIKEINKEIESKKRELEKKNNENINLEKEKKDLQQRIFKVEDTKDILVNKNDNANKEINDLKRKIKNKEEQEILHNKQIKELTDENEKLTEEKKESEKINKETNSIDFYDVIVGITSVKDISEGWKIKMNDNAKQKYEEFKKGEVIKIGVIGNANKGKSFLLSKISKIKLPSGKSIRTEGLSIKYPVLDEYKDRKIVLLDSAGLETPVLKNENEITNQVEDEIKEKDHFKEKSREKIITELFLQNYIINNSDILIIVVGILTYSEQKMLNRIRTEFLKARNNKTKVHKPLFIIHNLMAYKTSEQVKEYIDDFLLIIATFYLVIGHKISTKQEEKKGTYYYEKIQNQKIFHLIFAHDGSEAGNQYNNFTLDFLENSYQDVINLTNYDVIETIKDSFIEISKDILEKTENPITKNSFENSNNNLIKLSNANGVTLKKCLIDELGFSNLKGNGFEPTYNCYKKGNKIIVRVEVPGNMNLTASLEHNSSYNIIRVNGNKKKDKDPQKNEDMIFTNREFGKFSFDIPLNPEDCVKNAEPIIKEKKGLVMIEFELEEAKKTASLQTKEDEEI